MSDDVAPPSPERPAPEQPAPARKESSLRQLVDFGGLLAFGAAFLVMRLRGMSGDDALVHATWFLVAGSAVGVAVGLQAANGRHGVSTGGAGEALSSHSEEFSQRGRP